MRARAFVLLLVPVVGALALAACGDLKEADVEDSSKDDAGVLGTSPDASAEPEKPPAGSDGSAPGDDASKGDAAPSNFGPGPHGSLPSGYCCTADTECRYRKCVDTGAGGKMCLDECATDRFCTRPDISFTCPAVAGGEVRLCRPPTGFACLPASSFERGTKPIGACCNAGVAPANDGTAASACEGNYCLAVGQSPLVCTHRCEFQKDCPGGYVCSEAGASKACVPQKSGYTCE